MSYVLIGNIIVAISGFVLDSNNVILPECLNAEICASKSNFEKARGE